MADEAYRAVFLRVHPTGKMVLSLTTEADGKEAAVRAAGRRRARRARARRQGRARRTPTASASGTASTRARPPARRAAIVARHARRSATRRSCWRAWRWEAAPETLDLVERRLDERRRRRSRRGQTIADIALYAHGTGELPPGRRGRPRRAGRLPRLSRLEQAARVEHDLDLVDDLERPEQRRVGLHAPVGLLDGGRAR